MQRGQPPGPNPQDKAAALQAASPHGPRQVATAVCPVCRAELGAGTLAEIAPAMQALRR